MQPTKEKIKWSDFLKGLGVGVAFLIPGVSAGTMAIIFNLYDKIVNAINNLFKHFVTSLKILLPIVGGIIASILICWYPFKLAFDHIMLAIITLFVGFIIGNFPVLTKEVKNIKIKKRYLLALLIGFIVAVSLGVLSIYFEIDIQAFYDARPWWLYLVLIVAGIIPGIALVVPGISGSMVMIVLGFYKPSINLITNFVEWTNVGSTVGLFFSLGIGVVIGILIASKFMSYFLEKHRVITFYIIMGIIMGSIISMYFNFEIFSYYQEVGLRWWELLLAGFALALGFAFSYKITSLNHKKLEGEITNE